MIRLSRWRVILIAATALAMISSPTVRAQDSGTVAAANPETTPPAATEAATTQVPVPVATEAATIPAATETAAPVATEAATTPVPTSTPATTPVSTPTPTSTEAATVTADIDSPAGTVAATTKTPTLAPSSSQAALDTSATVLQDTTSPPSSFRGSEADSGASSSSSSSRDASATTTGTLEGSSTTKTVVITVLGGVGLTIVMSLLFVVWRSQNREGPDLNTPLPPDTGTITFPAISMPSIVAPTAQEMTAWKASGSSFASRDLPLTESTRAKLNATTRSSTEYDLSNRPSQIASLPARDTTTRTPEAARGTNASSEQSFSIRGYSEFSVLHGGDSESSAMTNDRYSTNDGYSTSDRYSTDDRYSTSSRLSSEPGRSNSGWFQRQVPKSLDMHRFSSTSSTASSIAARKHNPSTFINHDLTRTPSTDAPVTTDSTTSRTDVPDWYSVIESPTDNDRYTTSSLDSDSISNERESFEL